MSSVVFPAQPSVPIDKQRTVFNWIIQAVAHTMPFVLLTSIVLFVHGYHPYSQDAAIYLVGIEKGLNPSLFKANMPFVVSQTRLSIFSPAVVTLIRATGLRLNVFIFITYLASVALFLLACRKLAVRLFKTEWEQWGATLLPAALFTIPIAGTSLLMMDPYITARSFSTPLSIFAIVSCLDRSWKKVALWTIVVSLLHPLMGALLLCFLLILSLIIMKRRKLAVKMCFVGVIISGLFFLASYFQVTTQAYREVLATRDNLFLVEWHWYEVLGLIAPTLLMAITASRSKFHITRRQLATTCVLVGLTSMLVALLFVHPDHPGILVRIQVLRSFLLVYCIGAVMLGGFLVSWFWKRGIWVGITFFAIAFYGMFIADSLSYVQSSRLELPGATVVNPWTQAFLWIRGNTPTNAFFASDSTTFTIQDKDVQGFRAIAERDILSGAKDGGVATLFPRLAPRWLRYREAEKGIDHMTDSERIARLSPFGVTWILLQPQSKTFMRCPYRNEVVAVCRLRP